MTARTGTCVVLLLACLPGCGGDDPRPATSATPAVTACADAFNRERAADLGSHAYSEHAARRARVHEVDGACAVTFVVPESDEEFGAVGEVQRPDGWVSLIELGPRAAEIQRAAAGAANADVRSSGSVLLR